MAYRMIYKGIKTNTIIIIEYFDVGGYGIVEPAEYKYTKHFCIQIYFLNIGYETILVGVPQKSRGIRLKGDLCNHCHMLIKLKLNRAFI